MKLYSRRAMDRETAHAVGQAGEPDGRSAQTAHAIGPTQETQGRSTILAQAWPALPAAAALVYLLLRLAFDQAGYFPAAFTPAAAIAFLALAAFVAVPARRRIRTPALVALGSLAAFACWTGLSRAWSVVPDIAQLDMRRAMLYLALFAIGLIAADSARRAGLVVWSVLGAVTIVVAAGLLSRLQPDLISTPALIEGVRELPPELSAGLLERVRCARDDRRRAGGGPRRRPACCARAARARRRGGRAAARRDVPVAVARLVAWRCSRASSC